MEINNNKMDLGEQNWTYIVNFTPFYSIQQAIHRFDRIFSRDIPHNEYLHMHLLEEITAIALKIDQSK